MKVKKIVKFIPFGSKEVLKAYPNCGYYFTAYNEKGEGKGFFGTSPEDKQYIIERRLFNGVMHQRECGYGAGCFFNGWGQLKS